jgi:uncharacterized membrane protein
MRVFGHPLHPMLVHFPIAFWTAANACDALALFGVGGAWPLGWYALAAGCAMALPVATAGLLDIASLDDQAARVANRHMLAMVSALTAYSVALLVRSQGGDAAPEPALLPVALDGLGFVLLAIGGHLGASLVYRHGAGRYKGAP